MNRVVIPLSFAVALIASADASAASSSIVPGKPLEVRGHPLAPYAIHEECAKLGPGDRLEYRFESGAPLAFNIHYHEGKVVVLPVTREKVKSDAGEFRPLTAQDYCLTWEAGAEGTTIDYGALLIRGAAK